MPGLDGTGPLGLGPRTGRGMGLCPPQPPVFGGVRYQGYAAPPGYPTYPVSWWRPWAWFGRRWF
ncbi:MAG: hypothetical protein DRP63_06950, partial [Planctomycetota bacterium]